MKKISLTEKQINALVATSTVCVILVFIGCVLSISFLRFILVAFLCLALVVTVMIMFAFLKEMFDDFFLHFFEKKEEEKKEEIVEAIDKM